VKLALLKGNRFNPWHLQGFRLLPDDIEVTAFRAESEIQQYFAERDDAQPAFHIERIYFDTQKGNPVRRLGNMLAQRYANRTPRILPFAERLKDFDLIQSWEMFTDWTAEALEARTRWGIPLALMVWDNIPFNMERDPQRRALKAHTAEIADRFIVYTDRSRRMLRLEGVPEAKIRHIYPGVDIERFAPGPADRAALNLDGDEFVILFVGWLLPRKGIDYLLLALRELLNDPGLHGQRLRLLIVGSGPGRGRVEGLLDRLELRDICTFAGSLPYSRMPEVYRAVDVFVLPSIATPEWQEQFGMSLIEAMASGTPVVSTMSGAIPEIAEYTAALCQPNDFVSLYEALKNMILYPDRREELGKAGRKRAVNYFELRNHVDQLTRIYREMTQE